MPNPPELHVDPKELSSLSLAFVGDAVFATLARAYLVANSRKPARVLHQQAVGLVSARAQAHYVELLHPFLTEEEIGVLRRGRNAHKATGAKNASAQEYHASTGLEALFGWLYLQHRLARIDELFHCIWQDYLAGNHHTSGI